jgi:hypothetical protein
MLQTLIADARRHAAIGDFEDDVCLVSVSLSRRLG